MIHKDCDKNKKPKPRYNGVRYLKTLANAYVMYQKERKKEKRNYVCYRQYADVVIWFFVLIFRKVINESHSFYFPYNLGYIYIKAYKDGLVSPDKSINWKRTIQRKKLTGNINGHSYRWSYGFSWNTKGSTFENRKFYTMVMRKSDKLKEWGVGKTGLQESIVSASKDPTKPSIFRR